MSDSKNTARRRQVIVIGAGLSGLAACHLLSQYDVDVLVLEARDRVGGKTCVVKNNNVGGWVEMGGTYVNTGQDNIFNLAKEVGVESFLTYVEQPLVWHQYGESTLMWDYPITSLKWALNPKNMFREMKREWKGSNFLTKLFLPFSSSLVSLDIFNLLRTIDYNVTQLNHKEPWTSDVADEWDKKTMAQFLDETCWTKTGKSFGEMFVKSYISAMPHEISMLWYFNNCGQMGSDTTMEKQFVGGTQEICNQIANRQGVGKRILLDHPVQTIIQQDTGCTVITANGREFKSDYIIMAIPGAMQNKIVYDPPLPPLRNQLLQRMGLGSSVKCVLFYRKAFWREKGTCGISMILDSDLPIHFTLDASKPDGSHPALVTFVLADDARKFSELSREQKIKQISTAFAKVFGSEEALNPVHYEEMNWSAEQWSGGGFDVNYKPGVLTQYGKVLREPVGKMYLAGSATADKWQGFLEGAVQSGKRAAREVLYEMQKISHDEIWQPEPQSYDELPEVPPPTFFYRNLPSVPKFLKMLTIGSASILGGIMLCNNYDRMIIQAIRHK